MNKTLKLLIDDYQNRATSAEYKLALAKFCEAERVFMNALNNAQRKAYLELERIASEADVVGQDDFAKYLFENLKKFY